MKRDVAVALRWFHKAAEHGSAAAENEIVYLYEHGEGVAQNFETSGKWYRMAASHGLTEARQNLAVLAARKLRTVPGGKDEYSVSSGGSSARGQGFASGHGRSED